MHVPYMKTLYWKQIYEAVLQFGEAGFKLFVTTGVQTLCNQSILSLAKSEASLHVIEHLQTGSYRDLLPFISISLQTAHTNVIYFFI